MQFFENCNMTPTYVTGRFVSLSMKYVPKNQGLCVRLVGNTMVLGKKLQYILLEAKKHSCHSYTSCVLKNYVHQKLYTLDFRISEEFCRDIDHFMRISVSVYALL